MRLAVLSDIHGNLTALETVLADLAAAGGADLVWCLGDLASGGPRPAECVRRIRALAEADEGRTFKVIGGNADRDLVNGTRLRLPSAKDADALAAMVSDVEARDRVLNWCLAQLSYDDYEFLAKIRGQELAHEVKGYGWVIGYHAIPGDDETLFDADTPQEQALDYLLDREGRLGIGGHIHRQMDRDLGRWRAVNAGSVGMSFQTPGMAQYAILTFDGDDCTVDLRSVPYDTAALIADLDAVGYPVPQWMIKRIQPQQNA